MNILHYSLGLSPFRSGGLTKYSQDLIQEQSKNIEKVTLLYPGRYSLSKKVKIIKNNSFNEVNIFELINPNVVPLTEGVKEPEKVTKDISTKPYMEFLANLKPDIVHIHSLQGLHKEFIEACNYYNIKTMFTSHDYYGICPKSTLFDSNQSICTDYNSGLSCIKCNENGFSELAMHIMQSYPYRKIKEHRKIIESIKRLRNLKKNFKLKKKILSVNEILNINKDQTQLADINLKSNNYIILRDYYINILKKIDKIHFNSSVAKEVYTSYLGAKEIKEEKVIDIVHNGINNNINELNSCNSESKEFLNITYLGPYTVQKGFYELIETLDQLYNKGYTKWRFSAFGDNKEISVNSSYYNIHKKYTHNKLGEILSKSDVVIVPSLSKETFGFIGLEALSHGIPIVVSENVGVKDKIKNNKTGFIYKDREGLFAIIKDLIEDPKIINRLKKNILDDVEIHNIKIHNKKIIEYYNS